MPRLESRFVGQPYRAAVAPQIARLPLAVSSAVAAEAEEAAAALAAFDALLGSEIAPFAAVLLRSESAASSPIEQLTASARRIAEAEVNGSGTEHAEMIVDNVHAMQAALDLADHLDADAILQMHHALMRRSDPDIAGSFRTDQVWVGGPPSLGPGAPHQSDFVPPVAPRVPPPVSDLLEFSRRLDLHVIPQVAVAHAQFETIHPFSDGNGRVGRALMHAMLRAKGLTHQISVPISAGLLTDTAAYITALTAYRAGDIDPMVSGVARAILLGVAHGRDLVAELTEIRATWEARLAGLRSDALARRLADGLLQHPVISAPMARGILGVRNNEHRHVDALVERGILQSHTDHKTRNRTWRAQDVLTALDRDASRAGRRRHP